MINQPATPVVVEWGYLNDENGVLLAKRAFVIAINGELRTLDEAWQKLEATQQNRHDQEQSPAAPPRQEPSDQKAVDTEPTQEPTK